jgi:hypothetical protein
VDLQAVDMEADLETVDFAGSGYGGSPCGGSGFAASPCGGGGLGH